MGEPMPTSEALSLFEEREAKHGAVIADLRKRADDTEKLIASGYFEAIRSALRRVALLEALYAACLAADHYDTGLQVGDDYDKAMEALAENDAKKEKP